MIGSAVGFIVLALIVGAILLVVGVIVAYLRTRRLEREVRELREDVENLRTWLHWMEEQTGLEFGEEEPVEEEKWAEPEPEQRYEEAEQAYGTERDGTFREDRETPEETSREPVREGTEEPSERHGTVEEAMEGVNRDRKTTDHPPDTAEQVEQESGLNWEQFLGRRVLNWVGGVILVLGVLFFVRYAFSMMTPARKFASVMGAGVLGVAVSIFLAYREMYGELVKPAGAIGWSILFIGAMGSNGIEGLRVFSSPTPAFVLMLLVSTGMIIHSLWYRSELFTVGSYLFSYGSVFLYLFYLGEAGAEQFFLSSITIVIFASSITVLSYSLRWRRIPLVGLLLTYLFFAVLYSFEYPASLELPLAGNVASLPIVMVLLGLIWSVFQLLSFRSSETNYEILAQGVNLAGFAVLFSLNLHQFSPGSLPVFLMPLAGVYAGLVLFEHRRENWQIYNLYVVAATALTYAGAYYLTELNYVLVPTWIVLSQGLFALFLYTGHRVYRYLMIPGFAAGIFPLLILDIDRGMTTTLFGREVVGGWYLYWFYAVVGYGDWYILRKFVGDQVPIRHFREFFSWGGAGFFWFAVWLSVGVKMIPLAWGLASPVLFLFGFRQREKSLFFQSAPFLFSAICYVFLVDYGSYQSLEPLRALSFLLLAGFAWYMYEVLFEERNLDWFQDLYHPSFSTLFHHELYSGLVALLLLSAVWFELPRMFRPLAWGIISAGGYLLQRFRPNSFRIQHVVICASVICESVFIGFLDAPRPEYNLGNRAVGISIPAIGYLLIAYFLMDRRQENSENFWELTGYYIYPAGGLLMLTVLCYAEFTAQYVTILWGGIGLLVLVTGMVSRKQNLRYPSLVLLFLCVSRIVSVDLMRLEMLYRILSFIGLGVVLISASYLYLYFDRLLQKPEAGGEMS